MAIHYGLAGLANKLMLGQVVVGEKNQRSPRSRNSSTAGHLGLVIDAMRQRLSTRFGKKADYLMAVKENQPTHEQAIAELEQMPKT